MQIIKTNIWKYYPQNYIVIPTNGFIKNTGENVMGRGLALQVKDKFPSFPKRLGEELKKHGNVPFIFTEFKFITFPVKHNWWEKADLKLIENSAKELANWINIPSNIVMPKVGCANGRLKWSNVEPIIQKYFPNMLIVDWS